MKALTILADQNQNLCKQCKSRWDGSQRAFSDISIYTVCHSVYDLDWNPYFQHRTCPKSSPEVIKLFSCATQLSMKFVLLINLKLLTTANSFLLNIAEHEKFSANKHENANSWVEHEKSFYNLKARDGRVHFRKSGMKGLITSDCSAVRSWCPRPTKLAICKKKNIVLHKWALASVLYIMHVHSSR